MDDNDQDKHSVFSFRFVRCRVREVGKKCYQIRGGGGSVQRKSRMYLRNEKNILKAGLYALAASSLYILRNRQ
jgi:hypothetical protein